MSIPCPVHGFSDNIKSKNFLVTPYKVYVAIVIDSFVKIRSKCKQSQVGSFSRLIMKLIQSLDSSYLDTRSQIDSLNIPKLLSAIDSQVLEIQNGDIESLMDLIAGLKSHSQINKSSFIGFYVRKMYLFNDKLSFTSANDLLHSFKKYVLVKKVVILDLGPSKAQESKDSRSSRSLESKSNDLGSSRDHDEITNHKLWKNCPRQVQYFFSKQVKLINIDEKKALDPNMLSTIIDSASYDIENTTGLMVNELNFIKYVNYLRVNEYHLSKQALIAYFDLSSSPSLGKSWPSFNLAMFYLHFQHFDLAIQQIKECISASQESGDDKCLEYVLLLLVKILISKRTNCDNDQEIVSLLNHLISKSYKQECWSISAIAALHLEQIIGPSSHKALVSKHSSNSYADLDAPEVIAVKKFLDDVLLMTYANRAAMLMQIGLSVNSNVTSQMLLHLYSVETIGDHMVHRVNENTCLGIVNIAVYFWNHFGNYQSVMNMLSSLCSSIFSTYNSNVNSIWKLALAEITFEHYLFNNNLRDAKSQLDTIRLYDIKESKLRTIQFYLKRGSITQATQLVEDLWESMSKNQSSPYFIVRVLYLKAQTMKCVTTTLQCLEEAKEHSFLGIVSKCHILLATRLQELKLYSQSLLILRKVFIFLLSNGNCEDVATANYLFATGIHYLSKKSKNDLPTCLEYNKQAIVRFQIIGDYDNLKRCLKFQAMICHELGHLEDRNFWARKYRLLVS